MRYFKTTVTATYKDLVVPVKAHNIKEAVEVLTSDIYKAMPHVAIEKIEIEECEKHCGSEVPRVLLNSSEPIFIKADCSNCKNYNDPSGSKYSFCQNFKYDGVSPVIIAHATNCANYEYAHE